MTEESTRLILESQSLEEMLVEAVARAQLAEERADDAVAEREGLEEVVMSLRSELGMEKASAAPALVGLAAVGTSPGHRPSQDSAAGAFPIHHSPIRAALGAQNAASDRY